MKKKYFLLKVFFIFPTLPLGEKRQKKSSMGLKSMFLLLR